jgi:propionyl-CoA synthetase
LPSLFTAPTAFRAIRKEDPDGKLDRQIRSVRSYRALFLAGERADPDTIHWAERACFKVPMIDHWWQTETGWTIVGNPIGLGLLPVKYGLSDCSDAGLRCADPRRRGPFATLPGHARKYRGQITAAARLPADAVECRKPVPRCLSRRIPRILQDCRRRLSSTTMAICSIMARTDDIINVAGHRLSTGGMEEAVSGHPDVVECAVIGIADSMKGQIPAGFIVINNTNGRSEEDVEKEVVKLVRDQIGPVAAFKNVMVVKRLPKTRSGKILRATMQKIADGEAWKMPATIDDPAILDEISEVLAKRGITGKSD